MLVVKCFQQVAGRDYLDTFNPIIKANTIGVILAHVVLQKWRIHQL